MEIREAIKGCIPGWMLRCAGWDRRSDCGARLQWIPRARQARAEQTGWLIRAWTMPRRSNNIGKCAERGDARIEVVAEDGRMIQAEMIPKASKLVGGVRRWREMMADTGRRGRRRLSAGFGCQVDPQKRLGDSKVFLSDVRCPAGIRTDRLSSLVAALSRSLQ